mgnify:CR=1 FL=1
MKKLIDFGKFVFRSRLSFLRFTQKIRTAFYLVIFLYFLLPINHSLGQTTEFNNGLIITADRIEFDQDQKLMEATGNVQVHFDSKIIIAKSIKYFQKDKKLIIEGQIKVKFGEQIITLANSAELSDDLKSGIIFGANTLINNSFQVRSEKVSKLRDGSSEFFNAITSSCQVCAKQKSPIWDISASKIFHNKKEKVLIFTNAQFSIFGLPIFYTPFLKTPEPGTVRASGFLPPSISYSSSTGLGYKQPYFQVIDPYSDFTFSALFSNNGFNAADFEYREKFTAGDLSLFFEFDPNLLSDEKINIETDNEFKFEFKDNRLKNYLVNSEINVEKLKLNKQIQDLLYLKKIKTKLTFEDKILNVNLNSNYSFLDKNYKNESDNNIFNLKLKKNNSKFSDVEIFLKSDNNKINTKEFKKYLNFKGKNIIIEDQIINLNSNFIINASIDNLFNIKKFAVKSDLNFDNLNINFKSKLVKKYLKNFNNKIAVKSPNIFFEYSSDLLNLQLDGKYSLSDQEDDFLIKYKGNKNKYELYSLLDLKNSVLEIDEIQYYKKKNIPSKLEILINNSDKVSNVKKIIFTENLNYISAKNLKISDEFKIQSVDEIDVNFYNNNKILNNFKIKKNSNNYNFIGQQIDGEKLVERLLRGNSKNKISSFFDNITTSILFKLNSIYLEKNSYLKKFVGELDIKNNKLFSAEFDAILINNNEFSYSYRTTIKNEKITNIFIKEPKPFINNYKFIKGFEEGELKLNSIKIDNASRSNLRIQNFKVKEVPVLAKILTLASLQGMADLLTGEGIRFNELEMDFKTKNNLIEIDEMYAIGPAISIMMEGYIEKNRITSLRGTLVPATTINKTIAKIPLLGNILVGGKTGEGVFGVSFKIKGPPNNLKSTVNPIKTLTPRFITRTLENLKGS